MLVVHGEHGAGKSGHCRRLRALIDPNTAPLRADYREPRDLMICANAGWMVALDNLSHIPAWLSDCFCRLATGGGFSCRTLYENDEETIFHSQRPLVLNCIEEVVTRSDLLDRSILVNLPRIEESNRRSEKHLDREFDEALPRIMGALFDAVSTALRNEAKVILPKLPRMADLAIWATAAEPALDLRPGQFLDAYNANRAAGNKTAIESSPVGKAVMAFVAEARQWIGTATELLATLESRTDEKTKTLKTWPGGANMLSGAIKRLAPNLRDAGISVEFDKQGKRRTRIIVLGLKSEQLGNSSSASSGSSAAPETSEIPAMLTDDRADGADADLPPHSLVPEWAEV